MRRLFAVTVTALALVTAAQFFLAAMGAFDPAPNDESFVAHRGLGYFILFASFAVTALGAVARMPGRVVGLMGLSAGLILLQPLIRAAAKGVEGVTAAGSPAAEVVFGFHAINALAILGLLVWVARQAQVLAHPGAGPREARTPTAAGPPS